MIGVIARDQEKESVEEFFELFKTPWEYYKDGCSYDVVLTTGDDIEGIDAKLVIIYGSEIKKMDNEDNPPIPTFLKGGEGGFNRVLLGEDFLPIYGKMATFASSDKVLLRINKTNEAVGIEIENNDVNRRVFRIGYDLFQEIAYLLTHGQPVENASSPAMEIHISILRNRILSCGIPLIEIPPVPAGYSFIVCLTHDVDFVNIRDHKFDRTVAGFILRVLALRYLKDVNSQFSWYKLYKNWKALLLLPGVYMGLFKDFWFDIDRYMELEKETSSTDFFIPFKGQPGNSPADKLQTSRAASYDINDYKDLINELVKEGHEVGLHGIDAWHNPEMGIKEREVIQRMTGEKDIGVRMHWLYFSNESPTALEKAGFAYDSTRGYNNAVGYLSGTAQVFRLPDSSNISELPLIVMDTALFYSGRMGLNNYEAFNLCKKLITDMRTYGGAMTINWHTRSLSPERNWDDFYSELIKILKTENVWFTKAKEAVTWFHKRRSVRFCDVSISEKEVKLKVMPNMKDNLPPLMFRVYRPENEARKFEAMSGSKCNFTDIPWSGETEMVYAI